VVIYQVLSRNEKYVELGADYYDQRNKPRMVAQLLKRPTKLGYAVELRAAQPHPSVTAAQEASPGEQAKAPLSTPEAARGKGRPCKCKERGIICKHRTSSALNLSLSQTVEAGEFS
jgi:hypothetical protein